MQRFRFLPFALGCAALATGCGGDSATSPSGATATITITAAGVNPSTLTVDAGSVVRFVNQDSVNHDIASDPHPSHTDCPELNRVRLLKPGDSGETSAFSSGRSCKFHDHGQPSNAALKGTISAR
jgi:plastocyanin